MKCSICGCEILNGDLFCSNCGNTLKLNNPVKKHEIILRVSNCILALPTLMCLISLVFVGIMFMLCAFGGMACIESELPTVIDNSFIFIILLSIIICILFLTINISMVLKMRKIQKENIIITKYKKISKINYILVAIFLGQFGIHRFIIGDKKTGIIYLIMTLATCILKYTNISYLYIVSIICIMVCYSLVISDILIAISRIPDKQKYIYV